jgi:hypothetical protein
MMHTYTTSALEVEAELQVWGQPARTIEQDPVSEKKDLGQVWPSWDLTFYK